MADKVASRSPNVYAPMAVAQLMAIDLASFDSAGSEEFRQRALHSAYDRAVEILRYAEAHPVEAK